jgi:hypothetical protein
MTANITNNVRWTELLEDALNASPQWRRRVGDRFTRVINFAVDGMGMLQFAAMVRHHVLAFEPDFIIVNFVSDNILRRIRYVNVPAAAEDRKESIRLYVKTNFLEGIDWFSTCPELIVAAVGRRWGWRCMLPLEARDVLAAGPAFRFASRTQAIGSSVAAVRDMLSVFDNVLFLQMPLYQELEHYRDPEREGLVEAVRAGAPQARFASMLAQMEALLDGKRWRDRPDVKGKTLHQILALPEEQRLEIYRWFFLPDDLHYTDYGTTLYAREVAERLIGDASASADLGVPAEQRK